MGIFGGAPKVDPTETLRKQRELDEKQRLLDEKAELDALAKVQANISGKQSQRRSFVSALSEIGGTPTRKRFLKAV